MDYSGPNVTCTVYSIRLMPDCRVWRFLTRSPVYENNKSVCWCATQQLKYFWCAVMCKLHSVLVYFTTHEPIYNDERSYYATLFDSMFGWCTNNIEAKNLRCGIAILCSLGLIYYTFYCQEVRAKARDHCKNANVNQ